MKTLNELASENLDLFRQEELILEVTELLSRALEQNHMSKADLARKLRKSKAFVTQCLNGEQNLTLRTVADLFGAVGLKALVGAEPVSQGVRSVSRLYPIGGWSFEQSCKSAEEVLIDCAANASNQEDVVEPVYEAAA